MTPFIFQHVPKTAGTFVTEVLKATLPPEHLLLFKSDVEAQFACQDGATGAHAIAGHLSSRLIRRVFPGLPVITCLRDPVDRVISQFFYWLEKYPDAIACDTAGRYRLSVDPVADPWKELLRCLGDDRLWNYLELRDLQAHYLADHPYDRWLSESETFDLAMDWLSRAAVVGISGRIGSFLDQIGTFLGRTLPALSFAEPVNATTRRPTIEQVPPEVRAAIEQHNRVDIALFDEMRRRCDSGARRRTVPLAEMAVELAPPVARCWERSVVSEPAGFWDTAAFKQVPEVVPRNRMQLFYRLCSLQGPDADAAAIVEFQPMFGQQLAILGAIAHNTPRIIGIGFEDDSTLYPSLVGSRERCDAYLRDFLPDRSVSLFQEAPDGMAALRQNSGLAVRVGLVSRPFRSVDVYDQLRLFDEKLAADGFIYVQDVYNQLWPQVAEGLLRYLMGSGGRLAPAVIAYGGIVLCHRKRAPELIDLLQGFPEYQRNRHLSTLLGTSVLLIRNG